MQATKRVSNEEYNHTPLKKKRIAKPIQDPSTSSSVLQHVKNAANSEQSKPDTTGSKFSARTESMPKHPKEDKRLVSSLQKSFVKSKENEKVRPDDMTEASSPTVASSSDIPDHILYVYYLVLYIFCIQIKYDRFDHCSLNKVATC